MSDIRKAHKALQMRILEGAGDSSPAMRQAAFDNCGLAGPQGALVGKVAERAYRVTDQDIIEVEVAGLSEDQIFEIVVCAAVGQATRQYDEALTALEAAAGKE